MDIYYQIMEWNVLFKYHFVNNFNFHVIKIKLLLIVVIKIVINVIYIVNSVSNNMLLVMIKNHVNWDQ